VPHETQFGEVDGRSFDYREIGKAIVLGLGAIDRGLQHANVAIRLSCVQADELAGYGQVGRARSQLSLMQ
jgi:hypothetical protein